MIASTKIRIKFHFATSQPIKTLRKRLPYYLSHRGAEFRRVIVAKKYCQPPKELTIPI